MSGNQNTISFHDGKSAPQTGLGVWQVEDDIAASVVTTALEIGYRSIDTAAIYGNEPGVGKGIAQSGIARDELFITTKLWNDRHGHDLSKAALNESLEKLGLDYVDLYLIHWPAPAQGLFVQAWEGLIQLRDEGLAKSIGVSNFTIDHLQRLLDETGVLPVVNQIELHPNFQQQALREFHAEHDIVTEAWSPLGHGQLFQDPTLAGIAHKHGCTVAQVMLRWHIQSGHMVIPKSVHADRLAENFRILEQPLDADDMATIASLDQADGRSGPDPETFFLLK
ncbi:aldo/keto reductase [Pusillimonas sp. MFBS29]|uniref:aldo/keto reductase n=1 Tax=Pusillimonas sp. MFBS29 TaxID=2886690 RepID=UPI001D11C0C1|nr:aldo/keto reductase [Pusillimonas sp. MFBS29]MCC2595805.1 aldo/keto reductase [Pusillimonas sp. MFBS29]